MVTTQDQLLIRAALRDEVSAPLKQIIAELQATRAEAERLRAETEKQTKVLQNNSNTTRRAASETHKFGLGLHRLTGFAKVATGALLTMTKVGLLGVAGAAVIAAYSVFHVGSQYQSSVNTFQAVTRASTSQMAAMSSVAEKLGQDMTLPATSAADAAAAMTELAKGGLSVDASMRAAKGTLQLSAAAQIDAAKAATIQVNALNQFGLAAGKAGHVADLLANTANASSGEITDMAAALNYVGPVAKDFGLSIDNVSAALGVLGNAGIIGSQAGTSLRSALVNLAKPTKKNEEGIKALNLQLFDQKGHFLGLRAMTDQLWQAQKRLNPKEFNAALAKTFGKENLAAIAALASAGPQAYDKMAIAVERSGGAADVAKAKTKGLGGAVEGLKSQLETVAIDVWKSTSPTVEKWVRGWANAIPGIEKRVTSFVKGTARQIGALWQAGSTGNTKWAGLSLANMFGGSQSDWTAGINQAVSIVKDLATVFSQSLWPLVRQGASYWKLLLAPLAAARLALGFVAAHAKGFRQVLVALLITMAVWKAATTAVIAVERVQAAVAWINVVRTKQMTGATVAQKVAIYAWTAVQKIATAIQWAWNAAMSANPILLIVTLLAALTAGVIYAYTHWKWFRTAVDATWHALKWAWHWLEQAWDAVYKWVKNTGVVQGVWSGISTAVGWVVDKVKALWSWIQKVIDIAGQLADKVGGAISKVGGAISKVGGFVGGLNPFGDTATPHARGGSIGHTMGVAASIDRSVPGRRVVTSGYRTHGLGSSNSDHATGRALDLVGSGLFAYATAVRKAGGYAAFHGDGLNRHLHVAIGDGVGSGRGSMPMGAGPYGDSAVPRTRSGVRHDGGGMVIMPGGVQVIMGEQNNLTGDDVANAVTRGIADYMRDQGERS